ncbi:hypothetical protein [Pseudogemmobacter sonorensis]
MTLTFLLRFGGSEVYFGDFETQKTSRSEIAQLIGFDAVHAA